MELLILIEQIHQHENRRFFRLGKLNNFASTTYKPLRIYEKEKCPDIAEFGEYNISDQETLPVRQLPVPHIPTGMTGLLWRYINIPHIPVFERMCSIALYGSHRTLLIDTLDIKSMAWGCFAFLNKYMARDFVKYCPLPTITEDYVRSFDLVYWFQEKDVSGGFRKKLFHPSYISQSQEAADAVIKRRSSDFRMLKRAMAVDLHSLPIEEGSESVFEAAKRKFVYSDLEKQRIMNVANSIASMDGVASVGIQQITEAISYRYNLPIRPRQGEDL